MSTSAISSASATPQTPQATTGVAGYSRTRSLDLTITTRDGDTVTISAQQTTIAGSATTNGANGSSTAAAGLDSSSLQISVDGSLDPQELADIKKVLKTLADGARKQGLHGGGHGHHHHHDGKGEGSGLSRLSSVSGTFSTSVAVIGGVLTGGSAATSSATPSTDAAPPSDAPASDQTAPASDQIAAA